MEFTYALFLNLEPVLERQVWDMKKQFAAQHNLSAQSATRPHITVANAELDDTIEDELIAEIEKTTRVTRPVKIELSNYGNFRQASGNTIYIALADNKLQGFNLAANKAFGKNKSETLHVTIARGLDLVRFNKAWPKFAKAKFSAGCYADQATLTRVENNKYKTVHVFDFNPHAPDASQQGALF